MCSTTSSLLERVDAVAAQPVGSLTVAQLQELVVTAAQARDRLDGVASRAVGELHVRGSGQVPSSEGVACPTPAWLRSVARVSGSAAGRQVRLAVALRELPAVAEAVIDGLLTVEHARALSRLVGSIDPQALLDCQPQLIEVARACDPDQLGHYVRHLLATWCEPELEAEEEAAEQRRFLQLRNTHRGSWRGSFELPDAAMEILLTVLEPLARRAGKDDDRSAGQRRADALTDALGFALRHGDLPEAGGQRPRLSVVVPATWVAPLPRGFSRLDLDAHPGAACPTSPWTGPQTRAQVAALLCDARIERLALDASGRIVSLTTSTDDITPAQRRAVAARDRCCAAKGCSRPPAFCDVHHLRARADGGEHHVDNLVLLCRRHHVSWHRGALTASDLRLPWLRVTPPPQRSPARQ